MKKDKMRRSTNIQDIRSPAARAAYDRGMAIQERIDELVITKYTIDHNPVTGKRITTAPSKWGQEIDAELKKHGYDESNYRKRFKEAMERRSWRSIK